jgi:hypothetical protein
MSRMSSYKWFQRTRRTAPSSFAGLVSAGRLPAIRSAMILRALMLGVGWLVSQAALGEQNRYPNWVAHELHNRS